jgi:hypothetical protein
MKKARGEALEKIAVQIRELLNDAGDGPAPSTIDKINALERGYSMIHENYTIWPFRTRVLRSFCIAAVLPLLPTVIQWIVDLLGPTAGTRGS